MVSLALGGCVLSANSTLISVVSCSGYSATRRLPTTHKRFFYDTSPSLLGYSPAESPNVSVRLEKKLKNGIREVLQPVDGIYKGNPPQQLSSRRNKPYGTPHPISPVYRFLSNSPRPKKVVTELLMYTANGISSEIKTNQNVYNNHPNAAVPCLFWAINIVVVPTMTFL